jgi:hypothetical protein
MREKALKINTSAIPNMTDAIFYGSEQPGRLGWVEMYVNNKGRDAVNALFPKAYIDWKPTSGLRATWLPPDWFTFEINIPDVVAATETKLPLEITERPLRALKYGMLDDVKTASAFAMLLALGVKRQGARGGFEGCPDDPHTGGALTMRRLSGVSGIALNQGLIWYRRWASYCRASAARLMARPSSTCWRWSRSP